MKVFNFGLLVSAIVVSVCSGEKPNVDKRSVTTKLNGDSLRVTAKSKSDKIKDELSYVVKGENDFARIEVEYKFSNKTGDANIKTAEKFEMRLYELIEFTPTDISKGYQQDVDTVVQTIPKKWTWADITTSTEGDTGKFVLKSDDNLLVVSGTVAGGTKPNAVKVDVGVNDFPYQGNGTAIAIRAMFRTKSKITDKSASGSNEKMGVQWSNDANDPVAPQGFIAWVQTVDADGTDVDVISSKMTSNGDDKKMYFTFKTTDPIKNFLWDPEMGVEYLGDGSSASTIFMSLQALLFVMFCLN